jgi:amidase
MGLAQAEARNMKKMVGMVMPDPDSEYLAGEPFAELQHTTIAQLRDAMTGGELTAVDVVQQYLARVEALDTNGPQLNAVMEINPDVMELAAALDRERQAGHVRGPLHGIPILLKDNIDTADRMLTTAGSLALMGSAPDRDAAVVARLRAAGAVLLGKTTLSEWANFRSQFSSSGWCARSGQGRNAYALDRTPSGSSSGSGIATAAALCAAALATETDGSIVSPANASGVVGIKPSVPLVSSAGVIPISHSQDVVGVHGRCVADAAAVLGALAERSDQGAPVAMGAVRDYLQFMDPAGLKGARIGVVRNLGFGKHPNVDTAMEAALLALREAGAILIDPAPLPSDLQAAGEAEYQVLLFEFKADITAYLKARRDVALDREGFALSLAGLIDFNQAHAAEELRFFGQDIFEDAESHGPLTEPAYLQALEASRRLSGAEGIDRVMSEHRLDALVVPTGEPARPIDLINGDASALGTSSPAARAGYPTVTLPVGYAGGMPINMSFIGGLFSEPTLLRLGFALEQTIKVRQAPRYKRSLP